MDVDMDLEADDLSDMRPPPAKVPSRGCTSTAGRCMSRA